MLKRHSQFVLSALFVADMVCTAAAWLAAYWLRFELEIIPLRATPGFRGYLLALPWLLILSAISYSVCKLYVPRREGTFISEIFAIIQGTVLTLVLLVAASFAVKFNWSRAVAGLFVILNVLFLAIERGSARSLLRKARRHGLNLRYVLIVGGGKLGQRLYERIEKNPWTGFKVIGFLDDNPSRRRKGVCGLPVLGSVSDVAEVIREHNVDQLFIALPFEQQARLKEILDLISDETVDVRIVPDVFSFVTLNPQIADFDGLPILSLRESPLHGWNKILKRAFDIVFSLAALLVFLPVMAVIYVLIKIFTPGPALYKQKRMGMDGRIFDIYKFRTMKVDAERETGPVWATKDDPRRTPLGKFLRRYNLDELPQFFNVLLGHMSVVGPRPERPELIEKFKKSIPKYMLRHKTKAGITGWAQVNGWRGDTSLEKRIQYDLYYIENWSLWFDLQIIFRTIFSRESA